MAELIHWEKEGILVKTACVELCGWRNKLNKATPMGKRIANTSWDNLSTCAKNVLINHGISN